MMRVAFALFGLAAAQPLTPAEISAKLSQQTRDLSLPDSNRLPPSCANIMCADISDQCNPANGVEIEWKEGNCCPTCVSPDYKAEGFVVSTHLVPQAKTATESCKDALCFALKCQDREEPGPPSAGGCCNVCVKV